MKRPCSLEYVRTKKENPIDRPGFFRRALLVLGGYYSKESAIMRAAANLYRAVTEQAADADFKRTMQIGNDQFQQEYSLLCLHIWLLIRRLRSEGPDGKRLSQRVYDDFQYDVGNRVRKLGVRVRVSKQLETLEKQFYGSSLSYDKALGENSIESLADALQRNVYLEDPTKQQAACHMERYIKRELACLSMTSSEAVMVGNIKFSKF